MTGPRVYLGAIAVIPQKDLRRDMEKWRWNSEPQLETELHTHLCEIFALPPAASADTVLEMDLCLDVFVSGYRTGEGTIEAVANIGFPLFWRPKIELRAKLFRLSNGETVEIFSIAVRPSWREYLSKLFSWPAYFRLSPVFGKQEMEVLLSRASLRLLERVAAVAYK